MRRPDLLRWQSELISHRQGEPFIVVGVNLLPRMLTVDEFQAFVAHVNEVAAELEQTLTPQVDPIAKYINRVLVPLAKAKRKRTVA